jgi:hypothetical protein
MTGPVFREQLCPGRYPAPMNTSRRSPVRRPLTGLFVATALVVTACGTTATTDPASTTTPETEAATDTTAQNGWPVVVDLNAALASQDYDAAAALTAPGSAAQTYVQYRSDVAAAQQAAGAEATPAGVVVDDEQAGTVTVTIGSGDDEVSYVWSDFEVDAQGLVTEWSTEQGGLDTLISSPGSQAQAAGATVSVRSAYLTNEGNLLVVVGIVADDTVTIDESTVVRGDEETTVESSAVVGPAEVDGGESGVVVYQFDGAPLGGTLVYEVQNSYDAPVAVELPLT